MSFRDENAVSHRSIGRCIAFDDGGDFLRKSRAGDDGKSSKNRQKLHMIPV